MHKLARTETVNVHLRKFAFDVVQQIEIPLLAQFRVMPALHQNLRAAERDRFLDLLVDLLVRDDVGIVVPLSAIKGAEFAIDVADIRVIDVAINDVGDDLIAATVVGALLGELTAPVRKNPQSLQRQMVKSQRLSLINPLSVPDP